MTRSKYAAAHRSQARARVSPGGMNKTESAYARLLEARKESGDILSWEFEPLKLRLGRKCFYTVDFLVVASDMTLELHEVKGGAGWKLDEGGRLKWKFAGEKFPYLRVKAATRRKDGGWLIEVYEPRAAFPVCPPAQSLESARATGTCRICGETTKGKAGCQDRGGITANYGREYAHGNCLAAFPGVSQ